MSRWPKAWSSVPVLRLVGWLVGWLFDWLVVDVEGGRQRDRGVKFQAVAWRLTRPEALNPTRNPGKCRRIGACDCSLVTMIDFAFE